MTQAVAHSQEHRHILAAEVGMAKRLAHPLPMGRQVAILLALQGKYKAMAVFYLSVVHTLSTHRLGSKLIGYLVGQRLTAVVHHDNRFMFHMTHSFIGLYVYTRQQEPAHG